MIWSTRSTTSFPRSTTDMSQRSYGRVVSAPFLRSDLVDQRSQLTLHLGSDLYPVLLLGVGTSLGEDLLVGLSLNDGIAVETGVPTTQLSHVGSLLGSLLMRLGI